MTWKIAELRYPCLILAVVFVFALCSGCKTKYPERDVSLVWEATVPSDSAVPYCHDSGEVDVMLGLTDGELPLVRFSADGQKIGEFDLVSVPKRYKLVADWSTIHGRVGLDQSDAFPGTNAFHDIRMATWVKVYDYNGNVVWESQGPAGARMIDVNDSIIACYGKDPSTLLDLPSLDNVLPSQLEELVEQRYAGQPNLVTVFDTATGETIGQCDMPDDCVPVAVFTDPGSSDSMLIQFETRSGDNIIRAGSYDLKTGQALLDLDLSELLPDVPVKTTLPCSQGLIATGWNNLVSVISPTGDILWSGSPKGTRSNASASVGYIGYYSPPPYVFSTFAAESSRITALDQEGKESLNIENLGSVLRADLAERVLGVGKPTTESGPRVIYVLDLLGDSAEISQAEIPALDRIETSPSGEYIATTKTISDSESKVAVYKVR